VAVRVGLDLEGGEEIYHGDRSRLRVVESLSGWYGSRQHRGGEDEWTPGGLGDKYITLLETHHWNARSDEDTETHTYGRLKYGLGFAALDENVGRGPVNAGMEKRNHGRLGVKPCESHVPCGGGVRESTG
jgi:hypothetical protein